MRLSLLLLAAAASVASAQTYRLVDPSLSVDGRRVALVGTADGAGVLTITVPGDGVYRVAPQPFGAARRVGEFRGTGLVFAAGGRSVRLASRAPILDADAPAFATFEMATEEARGPARVSVGPADLPRVPPSDTPLLGRDGPTDRAELDRLRAERDRLRREVDRLTAVRQATADRPTSPVSAGEAAMSAQAALQIAVAERDRARSERDLAAAERDAARAERDALRLQVASLLAQRTTPATGPTTGAVSLPGFDFGRLRNAPAIERRLAALAAAGWGAPGRAAGEVVVLYQTDTSGRVVRTAVPVLLGGGLDAMAEALVSEMLFAPPVVDGLPAVLRSQVAVRFGP